LSCLNEPRGASDANLDGGVLLFLVIGVAGLRAQSAPGAAPAAKSEESIDSAGDTAGTSTTSATPQVDPGTPAPSWAHLVRIAATAGPIAFLILAWIVGLMVHYRMVIREQARFPAIRGTRAPQTVPMLISAALFFVPAVLFVVFEVRSLWEIGRGIGGVVDEWHPVTVHAWTSLLICLVLALIPWLFARRADTVA